MREQFALSILAAGMLLGIPCAAQSSPDANLPSQSKATDAQPASTPQDSTTSTFEIPIALPTATPVEMPAKTVDEVCSVIAANAELAPLAKSCNFALGVSKSLPDFTCQETIERSQFEKPLTDDLNSLHWQKVDVVSADVRFFHRGNEQYELYSNVALAVTDATGKMITKSVNMPDNLNEQGAADFLSKHVGGMLNLGELGSNLFMAFDPQDQAAIKRKGKQKKPPALLFNFKIKRQNSTYDWLVYSASTRPGINGMLAINPDNFNLERFSFEADSVDAAFPMDLLSIDTTYGMVSILGAGTFLLPKSSISMQCYRARETRGIRRINDARHELCFKNELEFHDCRKFGVDSRMITGPSK